jgi:tRNA U55 pseudouridine synthase TruB
VGYNVREMKRFVVLDKKIGETPLVAVKKWKRQNPEYASVTASYAGRLDPMASGKLLVLLGDECKRQSEHINLDKEYEIEVLLDICSDTGDALGLVEYLSKTTVVNDTLLKYALMKERGSHLRKYPVFSSKTVNGRPLFLHAIENNIKNIKIPEHIEQIYKISCQSIAKVSGSELKERVFKYLDLVPKSDEPSKKLGADFRIDKIRSRWTELLGKLPSRKFTVLNIKVACASGTYMRSLAGRVGESFDTKALALSIHRAKIGKYVSLWGIAGFWRKTYKN